MSASLRKIWTHAEFFDWAERQDGRFEFDGVQPVGMVGGTVNHSRIAHNIYAALRSRLRGGECEPLGPDAGVETVGQAIRYPDAVVSCTRTPGTARLLLAPVVVFEVVSPNSVREDHFVKFREYGAVETVRSYVVVESDFAGVTVHRRADRSSPFITTALTAEDTVALPAIGVTVPVVEFYDGTDLLPAGTPVA